MVTDDEIKKIKKMSKEEKMAYLENRIDQILSELPEEDKHAMMSASPQMMDNLFSGENMENMQKMMDKVFSSLSPEDMAKLQNMQDMFKGGGPPEDISQIMGAGMGLIGKIMEQMMTGEGMDLMNKMMQQMMGGSGNTQTIINISQESREKMEDIRELTEAIMADMNPEDVAELMQRIQAVYDKHLSG
ncbi:MAG: hypothetical protein WED07_02215 [Candidatus Freyarchaeum deiterrae]